VARGVPLNPTPWRRKSQKRPARPGNPLWHGVAVSGTIRGEGFEVAPQKFSGETVMERARSIFLHGLVATALLAGVWHPPARAADDDADLRRQALALNDITGKDALEARLVELVKDAAGTKKLLAVAEAIAKEKNQPFSYNAAYLLARAAHELKAVDAGRTFYRLCADEAVKLQSVQKIGQAYGGLILLLYEDKKYEECVKVCQELLEMKDEEVRSLKPRVAQQMIQALAKQGKIDQATKLVENLVKAQPENWLVLALQGWVHREAGRYAEAAKAYEDVVERVQKEKALDKEDKAEFIEMYRYILSNVYIDLDQVDKAAEHLKALLEAKPDDPTFNNDLGYIWADHDMNLEEAERLIRKALEEDKKIRRKLNPDLKPEEDKDNAAYLDSLGWVLFKQKRYKEAKPYLLQAVQDKEGQHIEILDHLGDLHMALGEKAEAIAAWKKGLEVAGPSKREQQRKVEVEKKLKAHE
jgi:tetratricopeptide (TPR) repeat protein